MPQQQARLLYYSYGKNGECMRPAMTMIGCYLLVYVVALGVGSVDDHEQELRDAEQNGWVIVSAAPRLSPFQLPQAYACPEVCDLAISERDGREYRCAE